MKVLPMQKKKKQNTAVQSTLFCTIAACFIEIHSKAVNIIQ